MADASSKGSSLPANTARNRRGFVLAAAATVGGLAAYQYILRPFVFEPIARVIGVNPPLN